MKLNISTKHGTQFKTLGIENICWDHSIKTCSGIIGVHLCVNTSVAYVVN